MEIVIHPIHLDFLPLEFLSERLNHQQYQTGKHDFHHYRIPVRPEESKFVKIQTTQAHP